MTYTEPRLYTRRRLADYFDRTAATIERWRRNGIVPEADGYMYDQPFWRETTLPIIERNVSVATGKRRTYLDGPPRRRAATPLPMPPPPQLTDDQKLVEIFALSPEGGERPH